jgi:hypothetical protein
LLNYQPPSSTLKTYILNLNPNHRWEEIASIESKLREIGIDLVGLFVEINKWERSQLQPITKYPAKLEEAMQAVCGLEEMHIVKVVYDMFENWPVFMYRGVKIPTCAIFNVPVECFVAPTDLGQNLICFHVYIPNIIRSSRLCKILSI